MSQKEEKINYLTVRFNTALLDFTVINNKSVNKISLNKLLNLKGNEELIKLQKKSKINLTQLEAEKLFGHISTNDTISISRLGKPVRIPPFWATFRVYKPDDVSFNIFYRSMKDLYPLIIYVDLPMIIEYHTVPNDTLYELQSSLNDINYPNAGINIEEAWQYEIGKEFIKVGVFDTGIDSSHNDINVVYGHKGGFNFDNPADSSWGDDYIAHGTSVAGIIAAKRNNNIGIAGIAGGDYTNSESLSNGISLFDFDNSSADADLNAVQLFDASRSPGTYYNWGNDIVTLANESYFYNALGYGINVNNHSYNYKILSLEDNSGKTIDEEDTTGISWPEIPDICRLCEESLLFSLKNGVVNVIGRGNGLGGITQNTNLYLEENSWPQRSPDSWVISVGASGTDGKRLALTNIDQGELAWWSPIGRNLDLLAPGSAANIVSLKTNYTNDPIKNKYKKFNGTSASAPHVTGVAALLLSKYNKPCYSNQNLDPADVEYILQKSATKISQNDYSEYEGWGRLNAGEALKMINFPEFQIVHPQEPYVEVNLLSQDTIHAFLDDPIYQDAGGPLGSSFDLELNRNYKMVRYEFETVYDFNSYMEAPYSTPSVELLDVWVRHSQTNSLKLINDTIRITTGNPAQPYLYIRDTFSVEPMAVIQDVVSNKVTMKGYYYHFLELLDISFSPLENIDFWYPMNPFQSDIRMAYSIYLKDPEQSHLIEFPCDSANVLIDPAASLLEKEQSVHFSVYPNPSNDKIFVSSLEAKSEAHITLVDGMGKFQFTQRFLPNQVNEIDIHTLSSGVYVIQIQYEDKLPIIKKIIKL